MHTILLCRLRCLHPSPCQLFFLEAVGPVVVMVAVGVAAGIAVVVAAGAVIPL